MTKSLHIRAVFLMSLICSLQFLSAQKNEGSEETIKNDYYFHYQDIDNFRTLLKRIYHEPDTLAIIQDYFDLASEGMKAWLQRYKFGPQRLRAALRYFPTYYEYLANLKTPLQELEPKISKGLDGLKALYPSDFVHIPPIYYFILFAGGGSVEMTATMISLDYFGLHKALDVSEFDRIGGLFPKGKLPLISLDHLPQVIVHETAHLLQAYMQGEVDYISMYNEKNRTIKSYLIREGGADFLTYLGAGLKDNIKFNYGEKHEESLWKQIEPLLDQDPNEHPGWFSNKSKLNPDWPYQIGYFVGFKIVEYYYEQAKDKKAALQTILNSHDNYHFDEFIQVYRKKWQK